MKKKKSLAERKKLPNSKYWQNKCKEIFMTQAHGKPCQVCGTTESTCYHHIVSQSRSKLLKFDLMNVVVLCPSHHTMGNDLAPHSTNTLAIGRFVDWLRENEPEKVSYCEEMEHVKTRKTYRDIYEELVEQYN
ncbi:MAG: HNH endonuclease signature motif containing protein [Candidatus Heimdallarchaeaceae archaeon]